MQVHLLIPASLYMAFCLTACATQPEVSHLATGTVRPEKQLATFALLPSDGEAHQHIASLVQRKLETLGYTTSSEPAFLVEVSVTQRSAVTGAFIPVEQASDSHHWVAQPETTRKTSRRKVMILLVRFLAPKTQMPFQTSSARYVPSNGDITSHAREMIDALFATAPLKLSALSSE